jgi:hypothetical protein
MLSRISDFPLNLMLSRSVQVADTAEDALKVMAGLLEQGERP